MSSGSSTTEVAGSINISEPEPVVRANMASLLGDPTFSDVTVLVGTQQKKYQLHRVIICMNFEFFKAACKEGTFLEDNTREIKLPEIQVPVFDAVVEWMYRGTCTTPEPMSDDTLVCLYEATSLLGMPAMRIEIQKAVAARIQKDKIANGAQTDLKAPDSTSLLERFAKVSTVSDWVGLREISDCIHPGYYLPKESLRDVALEKENLHLYCAITIDTLQDAFFTNFCADCLGNHLRMSRSACVCCRKSPPVEQRGEAKK